MQDTEQNTALAVSQLMLEQLASMAEYNQWMNNTIYQAAAQLSPAALAQPRGAFFGSILGTLNHLVVADTIWLQRFALHPASADALAPVAALETPAALNQMLFTQLHQLRDRREWLDQIIRQWVAQLRPEDLLQVLRYHNMRGQAATKVLGKLLQHFFNHQTHHRGQLSTLLLQAGVDIGVTDLLVLLPNANLEPG